MYEDKATTQYYRVTKSSAEQVTGAIIGESRWVLYVNDVEVVTFMATPRNLHHLALGFLASENLIARLDEIASLRVNEAADRAYWYIPALGVNETRAMVVCEENVGTIQARLTRDDFRVPAHRVLTSGCGGGVTFSDLSARQTPLDSKRTVRAAQLFAMMGELYAQGELYRATRGVHTSALTDGENILVLAEDVGRHNTLDKIRGECLMCGIETRDHLLLSTGRISSEMITKAAKMQVPIVASRTSPTSLALELARAWNIALIGYLRAEEMRVYCGVSRIVV
ncbi:MAG: formate dehydrogenase accessory sulfurtransferase FdhD [Chloroflexota bacterium]